MAEKSKEDIIMDSIRDQLIFEGDYRITSTLSKIQFTKRIQTMATNATYIYINPDWTLTLSPRARYGVFCHELMHITYNHKNAPWAKDKNHVLANICQDIIINEKLVEIGREIPKGGMFRKSAFGAQYSVPNGIKTSREIYNWAVDNVPEVKLQLAEAEMMKQRAQDKIVEGMGKTRKKSEETKKKEEESKRKDIIQKILEMQAGDYEDHD